MLDQYIAQWKSRTQALGGRSLVGLAPKRVGYGGGSWALSSEEENLRQPQDGAVEIRARVTEIRTGVNRPVQNEPEDARLTGGTRSLMRRLMGLNVTAAVKAAPVAAVQLALSGPRAVAIAAKKQAQVA